MVRLLGIDIDPAFDRQMTGVSPATFITGMARLRGIDIGQRLTVKRPAFDRPHLPSAGTTHGPTRGKRLTDSLTSKVLRKGVG